MKPNTVEEAKDRGYDEGRDTTGMVGYYETWPTEADYDKPDNILRAFMEGFKEGEADRHEPMPAWAMPDEPFRSDATPGL